MLTRLKRSYPATAKDFDIKHLAQSEAPFRLLSDLTESVHHSSPLKFNIFIALSYCWHSDDWSPAQGLSKMDEWPLSSLMLLGLFHQRQSPNEGVWIDACYIEQSNEVEKRQAIGSMEVVYKSARMIFAVIDTLRAGSGSSCGVYSGRIWHLERE